MTEDTTRAVSFTGAYKSFGSKEVLHGLNFHIERGEVVSLIGPSGAGKSTTLRCLTLLERLDRGRIAYGDTVVCDNEGSKGAVYDRTAEQAARMHFGLVFQGYNLFPHRTVLQNVCDAPVVVQKRDEEEVQKQGKELLERLDLKEQENMVPCELSDGQQQRVAIARALCMNPGVMYFDEATSALDPKLTWDMRDLIRQLAQQGMAVGIVTHEMDFAETVSDRICLLIGGEIIEEGSPQSIVKSATDPRTQAFLSFANKA